MIDSIYKKDKHYCCQVFLEECKYDVKEKETSKFITDDVEISSYSSDKEDSDDKNWWGKLSIEIFFRKI